jgi:methylmalonyl-CoA/ethylmalonyl-CoA epimerase
VSVLRRIHHVNLLVRDLDAAVARYTEALGVEGWIYGELAARGVRTARFRAGESWVVLVQPMEPQSAPGRYLADHGEGLFLLSFGVDDLDSALARLETGSAALRAGPERRGLEGWRIADLSVEAFFGAPLQLTEDP